jgi:hypothetical protein
VDFYQGFSEKNHSGNGLTRISRIFTNSIRVNGVQFAPKVSVTRASAHGAGAETNGVQAFAPASVELGISHPTLYELMEKLKITKE